MKNAKLHGVRVESKFHPLDGNLKYHVFDVDEVEPLCHNVHSKNHWDWRRGVPWNHIPNNLKCPQCLQMMLDEDGNRWGIK